MKCYNEKNNIYRYILENWSPKSFSISRRYDRKLNTLPNNLKTTVKRKRNNHQHERDNRFEYSQWKWKESRNPRRCGT